MDARRDGNMVRGLRKWVMTEILEGARLPLHLRPPALGGRGYSDARRYPLPAHAGARESHRSGQRSRTARSYVSFPDSKIPLAGSIQASDAIFYTIIIIVVVVAASIIG